MSDCQTPGQVSLRRGLESFVASEGWERLVRIDGPNRWKGSVRTFELPLSCQGIDIVVLE